LVKSASSIYTLSRLLCRVYVNTYGGAVCAQPIRALDGCGAYLRTLWCGVSWIHTVRAQLGCAQPALS